MSFDAIVVGAGIAGPPLAAALAREGNSVLLVERDWSEPDRIVGELLQPGGVVALDKLGFKQALEGIDSIPVLGYCVIYNNHQVPIPYPIPHQGRSFHHGRFIQQLRRISKSQQGVQTLQATVKSLSVNNDVVTGIITSDSQSFTAPLTFIADGCFSNLRKSALKKLNPPRTCSWFVGLILHDCQLPMHHHGNVILGDDHACILLYQIGENDVRILMDVRGDRPSTSKLPAHIHSHILPYLPKSVQQPLLNALADPDQRLRIMPNTYMRPSAQRSHTRRGAVLMGDAHNQRHPLTGGGMTCALTDVHTLSTELRGVDLRNWEDVHRCLRNWDSQRRSTAGTVNTLSMALYDLFSGDNENLKVLRQGCFEYFLQGGECVNGPVGLLSAVTPQPLLLFYHFFAVAFKSIVVLYKQSTHNLLFTTYRALHVLLAACYTLLPTMVMELVPLERILNHGVFIAIVALFALIIAIYTQYR
ncbi:hypothetical protein E3P86_03626 [Wallemia ichthyophaga]|uniref:Squalene monooxygenase n=1 Tax=Wallemia ichthyophaga TaxID=245174 RepID=A0A4V4M404_WALIC|nr:hypothetical protein E3P86_03626 [Wallemia ichthyophaga]